LCFVVTACFDCLLCYILEEMQSELRTFVSSTSVLFERSPFDSPQPPSPEEIFDVLSENNSLREQMQAHPELLEQCLGSELSDMLPKDAIQPIQQPSPDEVLEVLEENERLREQMQAHPELLKQCLSRELMEKLPLPKLTDEKESLSQQDMFEVLTEDESLLEQMQAHPELLSKCLSSELIHQLPNKTQRIMERQTEIKFE